MASQVWPRCRHTQGGAGGTRALPVAWQRRRCQLARRAATPPSGTVKRTHGRMRAPVLAPYSTTVSTCCAVVGDGAWGGSAGSEDVLDRRQVLQPRALASQAAQSRSAPAVSLQVERRDARTVVVPLPLARHMNSDDRRRRVADAQVMPPLTTMRG
jgi:hypothetical protein